MTICGKKGAMLTLLLSILLLLFPPAAFSGHAASQAASSIALLPDREYPEALLAGIRGARNRIACSFYLFKIGDGQNNLPRLVAEELVRAARRGVTVTVILERSGRENDNIDTDNSRAAAFLSSKGVTVYFDRPDVTSHSKVVVIDGRWVFLGSHNITQAALRHNNEMSVVVDSPELATRTLSFLEMELNGKGSGRH